MTVIELTATPIRDDVAIGTSQSLGGAGNFTLNGTFASGGEVDFTSNNIMCIVQVRSNGDDSGLTFTFTGEDFNGNTVTESVSGSNGGYARSTKYFAKVTQVSSDGATADNVTLGTCDDSVTDFRYIDQQRDLSLTAFSVELSSGSNMLYSMQIAQSIDPGNDDSPFVVFDSRLTSLRKSTVATGATPSSGQRIRVTEYVTGSLTFRIRQAGT